MLFESGQTDKRSRAKAFEGISKAVCERITHSRRNNVNSYRTDEDFL